MLFLVDAQLPPALAEALRQADQDAIHVADLGMLAATDQEIWDETVARAAILVTKDRDFLLLRSTKSDGPAIIWVRTGNTDNRTLITQMLRALPAIHDAIERGERSSNSSESLDLLRRLVGLLRPPPRASTRLRQHRP